MIISEELLLQYGAIEDYYETHTIIFREGDTPQFYHQIIKGTFCISSKDPISKITTLLQYFKDYHQNKWQYT